MTLKKTRPLITVVIPAYNEEKLLPKCLEALKNQAFQKPYEVVLVDNFSSDKTANIGKNFGCRVVKETKKGQIFAKQRGCMEARGEIIAVLDADCIPATNWLSVIYEKLKKEINAGAITNLYAFDKNTPLWHKIHDIFLMRPVFKIEHVLLHSGRVIGGNVAFRKENFLKVGGYNIKSNSIAESELGLASRLGKIGKIKHVQQMIVKTDSRVLERGFWCFVNKYYISYLSSYLLSRLYKRPVVTDVPDYR
jgi:glycosyltransferase involved in cell wall biosynthesis